MPLYQLSVSTGFKKIKNREEHKHGDKLYWTGKNIEIIGDEIKYPEYKYYGDDKGLRDV